MATLFINTARSEFVARLFTIPIIEIHYAKKNLLLTSILTAICITAYLSLDNLLSTLPNNRILELLDLSQSTSASKRHHLSMYAMNTIANSPVLGDYASYTPGFYSHNVLSAWVDTGIFGFLSVLALMIIPTVQTFIRGYFFQSAPVYSSSHFHAPASPCYY